MSFSDFDPNDPYEINQAEAKANKKKAGECADELLAAHMLNQFLPGDMEMLTGQRIMMAWLTTLKGFKQFYEGQFRNLPDGEEAQLARKVKSNWEAISLGTKDDFKDIDEFARLVVQYLFEGEGAQNSDAATLKQIWRVQASALPKEPSRRQKEPAAWQLSMGDRRSSVYKELLDPEKQGSLIIEVVYKLADGGRKKKLKKYRDDKFELEYQRITQEMRDDPVREARITRKLEDKARADKVKADRAEAREARRNKSE